MAVIATAATFAAWFICERVVSSTDEVTPMGIELATMLDQVASLWAVAPVAPLAPIDSVWSGMGVPLTTWSPGSSA